MTARRCASLSPAQPAISRSVRPQPMHSPVAPLTAQTLMQGVEIGGRGGSVIRLKLEARFIRRNACFGRVISIINKLH